MSISQRNKPDRFVFFGGEMFRMTPSTLTRMLKDVTAGKQRPFPDYRAARVHDPIYLDNITVEAAQALLDGGTPEEAMDAQAFTGMKTTG
jgi:hypothetical protein